MRKSIFDIVSESIDMNSEIRRILAMARREDVLCVDKYSYFTLFDFIDEYCFIEWECRGHFINVDDFLEALDFGNLEKSATFDVDSLLTLIELVYNFWNLSHKQFDDNDKYYQLQYCGNYYHLKNVMDDILEQYNHIAYINEKEKCVLVIENKEDVTAVAEILPSTLSLDVIKYNHRSLNGEIELKKSILLKLSNELEPKRKELEKINKQLSQDIFFMLNNLNIRHNNRSKKDKNYKEYVAKMKKDSLEKWYDELYQMILLAFLLLDNVNRIPQVEELKTKLSEEKDNGQSQNTDSE